MVKIYKQPFAHGGDTIAIPDASQPDGKMSNVDGWTPDYQLPKTDPNYKPVGRQEMNGVFKEVTEALGQVQVQGSATWLADGAPYPINAQVYHNGKQWMALRENSVAPVDGSDWVAVGTNFATAAEAQALTSLTKLLTPGRLNDAFKGGSQSLASNGYQKLPGGLILQWGVTPAITPNQLITFDFPIAFPTAGYQAILTYDNPDINVNSVPNIAASLTRTSLSAKCSDTVLVVPRWRYIAIGR